MKTNLQLKQDIRQWDPKVGVKFSLKLYWQFIRVSVWLLAGNHTVASGEFQKLALRIEYLLRSSGSNFTVLYLKEAHHIMVKTLAGETMKSDKDFRVSLRRGLPLIIPGSLRLLIEAKDTRMIKLTLTILSVFRVIPATPKLKLSSITAPFKGLVKTLPEMGLVVQELRVRTRGNPAYEYFDQIIRSFPVRGRDLIRLTTAGPNAKNQITGYPLDAIAFKENPQLLEWYNVFAKNTNHRSLSEDLKADYTWAEMNQSKVISPETGFTMKDLYAAHKVGSSNTSLRLGKLSLKLEAAGKVRVFAIVDAWTQSLLRPLHLALFDLLRSIKQDGTFNQLKPVKILMEKGLKDFYSFDLTAATDRLPIDIQVDLLSLLFNNMETALAWKGLLIDRDYVLDSKDPQFSSENGIYRYSVGQPMGALSSWAMLALTHHMIVQIAAHRIGRKGWFEDYAILGDDVTIADTSVAQAYLVIMNSLGVDINLSKSVESHIGACEFAKKIIVDSVDYSPIGVKELFEFIYSPKRFKDLVINNNLLLLNLGPNDLDFNTVSMFLTELASSEKIRMSRKWLSAIQSTYWDLLGLFGFNLTEGLSPIFSDQAINSLSDEESKDLKDILIDILKSRIAQDYFKAFDADVKMYSKIRRYLSLESYVQFFPSTQNLLSSYSEDMMKHTYRPLIGYETLELDELLKLAFSDQTFLSDPLQKEQNTKRRSIRSKSLILSKLLVNRLGQNSPHLLLKVMQANQAPIDAVEASRTSKTMEVIEESV